MQLKLTNNGKTVLFELNDSPAAQALSAQLPLNLKLEDYGRTEKIFYPAKLAVGKTPKATGKRGELAYYAPWGDVVIFYHDFGPASGLYALGKCVSDLEKLAELKGESLLERV